MAIATNTYTKYTAIGLRESLSDAIYDISPEDTPFLSSCGRGTAKQTLEEWQTDVLGAAASNAQLEGDDSPSAAAVTPTVRVGNYCQISRKVITVSGTLEEIDKAGRKSEMAYQLARRSAELKLDMEYACLQAQAGNAGSTTTARTLAGINAWVKTNVEVGTSGEDPVYTSGVPSAVRTDGTQVAYTETIAKAVIQSVWTAGGKPRTWFVGPVNKQKFSAFDGVVTQNYNLSAPKATAIIASADVYVSDFGTMRVIPTRGQRERDAWLLDFDLLDILYLRPFKTVPMAVTGDATKKMLIVEYTLKVKQEKGLGLAADLTTT
jgi:hypothetical protein